MTEKKKKVVLRDKLIEDGWFETEKEASSWTMLKRIIVNDQLVSSIYERVDADCIIRIKEYYKRKYVNKGGIKLEKAIKDFNLDVSDKIALDCGASTGGFTDCLLQHGARLVYAVDVGYGQLAGKLLINERVINLEKTNIGAAKLLTLNPTPDIITLDLSYLSLKTAVPICLSIIKNNGILVCLVKPIYEVENNDVKRTGKINDPEMHEGILDDLINSFIDLGLNILGLINSPIRGNNDAIEYLVGLGTIKNDVKKLTNKDKIDIRTVINNAFELKKFKKNYYVSN